MTLVTPGRINLYGGLESLSVERSDEYPHPLVVKLVSEGKVVVEVRCEHFYDTAEELRSMFESAVSKLDSIISNWEDTPEPHDGWISFGRGQYYVRLEDSDVGTFPTQDIAEIELAEAMVKGGVFPNCWCENDRGITHSIDDEIRALHDEGGDGMKPLVGVEYEPGAEILVRYPDGDWLGAYVVRDYGQAGIVYQYRGDDEKHHVEDRSEVRPDDEENDPG
jgi:hypothetical protein